MGTQARQRPVLRRADRWGLSAASTPNSCGSQLRHFQVHFQYMWVWNGKQSIPFSCSPNSQPHPTEEHILDFFLVSSGHFKCPHKILTILLFSLSVSINFLIRKMRVWAHSSHVLLFVLLVILFHIFHLWLLHNCLSQSDNITLYLLPIEIGRKLTLLHTPSTFFPFYQPYHYFYIVKVCNTRVL